MAISRRLMHHNWVNYVLSEAWEQCRIPSDWGVMPVDMEFHIRRHVILDMEQYINDSGEGLNKALMMCHIYLVYSIYVQRS